MKMSKPDSLFEVYVVARVADTKGDIVTVLGRHHGTAALFWRFDHNLKPPYEDFGFCLFLLGKKAARKLDRQKEHEVLDWLMNGPVETLPGMGPPTAPWFYRNRKGEIVCGSDPVEAAPALPPVA